MILRHSFFLRPYEPIAGQYYTWKAYGFLRDWGIFRSEEKVQKIIFRRPRQDYQNPKSMGIKTHKFNRYIPYYTTFVVPKNKNKRFLFFGGHTARPGSSPTFFFLTTLYSLASQIRLFHTHRTRTPIFRAGTTILPL